MGVIPYQYFVFGGKSSADFGVWISGTGTYDAPARDIEMVSVPGRNGDLTFDNGRFSNIVVKYPAFITKWFRTRIDDFRAYMCAHHSYVRLEDTYHPEEYRLALYKSGLSVDVAGRMSAGSFDIEFECKPQRFLKAGDEPLPFGAAGTIYNPTLYPARPLVRCYGTSGTVTVNGTPVSVTGCSEYADIDCDLMEVYEGSTNRNGTTTLVNGAFPVLDPEENDVSFTGWSRVEVTPRWWTI